MTGVAVQRHPFTVSEYEQIARAGVLPEDRRYELIEWDIIELAAKGSRHVSGVINLSDRFARGLGESAYVSTQNAVVLSEHSEPEPDIAILVRRPDLYYNHLPTVADILLIFEVADASLRFDRESKIVMYARAEVLESWLLAVPEDRLLVCRDPAPNGYQTVRSFSRGDIVAPVAFPRFSIAGADILGSPNPVRRPGPP